MNNKMVQWTTRLIDLQDSITHLNENMNPLDDPAWEQRFALAEIKSLQKKRDKLLYEMVHEWDVLVARNKELMEEVRNHEGW